MSKKLNKHLQDMIKKDKCSKDFIEGGHYIQKIYETSLIKILGKKLGIKVSNYLIEVSLKGSSKKRK